MQKWKYLVIEYNPDDYRVSIVDTYLKNIEDSFILQKPQGAPIDQFLEQAGKEGWEIATSLYQGIKVTIILKKLIENT